MTVHQILQEELPDIPEADRGFILWNFTGYPEFWKDATGTPEENLRAELREFREGVKTEEEENEHNGN